ncbi:DUF6596 domain-containing protein [Streptomyces sp. A244]|uniref:DUF6596 domain-containing protein n=1 Tax=Streptomyces sp. A244 TaxID=2137016 RepID=UPI00269A192D
MCDQRTSWSQLLKGLHIGALATTAPSPYRWLLVEIPEAIRFTRLPHRLVPEDAEPTGLLALMLLTEARRPARTGPHGELVPLAEQDRGRWGPGLVTEGVDLISRTLPRGQTGRYQLQAARAAVHDEAEHTDATDWPPDPRPLRPDLLEQFGPNLVVSLNRAIAVAMVHGPSAGLDLLVELEGDKRLAQHHRLLATRAHLLERLGRHQAAARAYCEAAGQNHQRPERRHLTHRTRLRQNPA